MARPSAERMAMSPANLVQKPRRSDRFLDALDAAERVVFISHVQPDPDSLGSMWGLSQLVQDRLGLPTVLTQDGGIFRAENRAFVDLLHLELLPVSKYVRRTGDALVMVDSQPGTGRHSNNALGTMTAVIDHHVTPGQLDGVPFTDIRPDLGATCTLVTKYLVEQRSNIPPKLATALLYGIETELSGFPREGTAADDDALAHLFPLAEKDLLAQIRHARLPKSHFEVLAMALRNAAVFDRVAFAWVDALVQPEQAAEVVDFLIRYEHIDWAICAGVHGQRVVLSARAARSNARAGELLREAVGDLGNAGGHERRAGGCVVLNDVTSTSLDRLRQELTRRCVRAFGASSAIPSPLVPTSASRK